MDKLHIILLSYCLIITLIVVSKMLTMLVQNNQYKNQFNKSLEYTSTVINQLKQTQIETSQNYNSQVNRLNSKLRSLNDMVDDILSNNFNNENSYTEYLENTSNFLNKEDDNIKVITNKNNKKVTNMNIADFKNEDCPNCKAILIGNDKGQRWCSDNCGFKLITTEDINNYNRSKIEKNITRTNLQIKGKNITTKDFIKKDPPFIEDLNNDINLLKPKINKQTFIKYKSDDMTLGELLNS